MPTDRASDQSADLNINQIRLRKVAGLLSGIETVIDAGAAKGDWSRNLRELLPSVRIIAIEPLINFNNDFFKSSNLDLVKCAVFSECREVTLNVTSDFYSSSLLYEGERKVKVSGRTLECICEELRIGHGEIFLKTDLQGFDFDALLSMGRFLSQVSLVQMECQLAPYSIGMQGLTDRINRMHILGFHVIDIFNLMDRPSDNMLGQVDVLFRRNVNEVQDILAWN